jgi:phospholipid/cholesterol/gamma-HCH transport system substrate-binding protein
MADKSKAALTWTELRVGVVTIVSLSVLAFAILYIGGGGGSPFAPKYHVRALMTDVNGLKPGAPVRLGGVEVGTVTRVDFAPEGGAGMVEVVMRMDRRVKLRITTESKASLGSLGLLGEKAVDITSATHGQSIEDGGYLSAATEDPFRGLLTDASGSTQHLRKILSRMDAGEGLIGKALRDEELYDRMLDVSVRLQKFMSKVESEKTPFGRLTTDAEMSQRLADSVKSIEAIVSRVERGDGPLGALVSDEKAARDLKSLVTNLDEISSGLRKGDGTAGRLLQDEALFKSLDSLSGRLDAVLGRLERGEGAAGRLLHDPELYDNLNGALKDLRGLLGDVRRDPHKYLRLKLSLF